MRQTNMIWPTIPVPRALTVGDARQYFPIAAMAAGRRHAAISSSARRPTAFAVCTDAQCQALWLARPRACWMTADASIVVI